MIVSWIRGLLVLGLVCSPVLATVAICNEAVCASVVSKCMLTQSCKCDLTHCSCCKDCYTCLSNLFNECCSCVDMCPEAESPSDATPRSYVENFPDDVPGLFAVLTSEPDSLNRWRAISVPITTNDLSLQKVDAEPLKQNCTVAYMSQCMSWNKCKASCQSMGSSSFRWFHDGCCECNGETCINYGLDESRCLGCGEGAHREEESLDDDVDYGEDMDPQPTDSYT